MQTDWFKLFDSREEADNSIAVGTAVKVLAGESKICLARTSEGFYAVDDECPHAGAPMSRGTVNYLGEIVCPWHAYRFNLKTGVEVNDKPCKLRIHLTEVREDGFYIGVLSKKKK